MPNMEIRSRNNEKIKHFVRLTGSARQRRAEGLFTLEGLRLCADAERSGYEISELYLTAEAAEKYAEKLTALQKSCACEYLVTPEAADRLSDTVHPQGVFCVAALREQKRFRLLRGGKYIALENVQSPENLGAAARTAEALGIDALLLSRGCDLYNPKAQRAAMGSLLRLPVMETEDMAALLCEARQDGLPTFAAVPDASAKKITEVDFSGGALVVIGNEGCGVSRESREAAGGSFTVPMSGGAESLNAAAAAAIIMWEMMR